MQPSEGAVVKYRGPALTPKLLDIVDETTSAIVARLHVATSYTTALQLTPMIREQVRAAVMNTELTVNAHQAERSTRR